MCNLVEGKYKDKKKMPLQLAPMISKLFKGLSTIVMGQYFREKKALGVQLW